MATLGSLAALFALAVFCPTYGSQVPVFASSLGKIPVPKAAYANLFKTNTLLLSTFTFNTLGISQVKAIPGIDSHFGDLANAPQRTPLPATMWPNEIREAPDELFGFPTYIVAGGFFIPPTNIASIKAVDPARSGLFGIGNAHKHLTHINILDGLPGFYHMVKFADVNGDGLLDIIAARCVVHFPTGPRKGELIWLEHPAANKNAWDSEWREHVLFEGPETIFDIADVNGDGKWEVVAANFFVPKLEFYYTDGTLAAGPWHTRIVDASLGPMMGAQFVDLNLDGKLEIIATNHVGSANATIAGIYAYEIPSDIATGIFTRHPLKTGIRCTMTGSTDASPGLPRPFHPITPAPAGQRPLILLAGDGAENVLVLQSVNDGWDYETLELITWTGTAGGMAVGDTDGDGFAEVFAPNWDAGYVQVWEFAGDSANGAVELQPVAW